MAGEPHFRTDIQGLRGVAVLIVVLFHADVLFSGGFIGVDVFFVVSGFVITQLLTRELAGSGSVNLAGFYARRVRRLLPASLVATMATVVAWTFLLSPGRLQLATGRTAVASSFFVANLYLYRAGNDYFGAADAENPLLHMWTLSVEEQFYLVLPLILFGSWRGARRITGVDPRRAATIVVGCTAAVSGLVAGIVTLAPAVIPSADRFAFYSPLTRAWEFCAGVILALLGGWLVGLGSRAATAMGALGLMILAVSACVMDADTPFPIATFWPVVAALALLVAGTASSPVRTGLSCRPLTWVGDRSYGWYLWHWPMIVLTRTLWPAWPRLVVLAAGLALVPAAASYRFLERPAHRRASIRGLRAIGLALVCILVPAALGAGLATGTFRRLAVDEPDGWTDARLAVLTGCGDQSDFSAWLPQCTFRTADARGTILLIGDSHAASASDGVVAAGHALGYDVIVRFRSGCPFLQDRPTFDLPRCGEWQQASLDLIDDVDPALVMIVNRSAGYTLPEGPEGEVWRTISLSDGSEPRSETAAVRSWGEGLDGALSALSARGTPVALFLVVPEFPRDFSASVTLVRPSPDVPEMTLKDVEDRRGAVVDREREIASRYPNVTVFDPVPVLCPEALCSPQRDAAWIYMDNHHLNPRGSRLLTGALTAVLGDELGLP